MVKRNLPCLAITLTILYLIESVNCRPSLAPLHVHSKENRIPGRYIVVLKDDVDVDSFATEFETSDLHGSSENKMGHKYYHAIKGFSAQLSENTLEKLRTSDHVKLIEEDAIFRAASWVPSWGLDRIDQRRLPLDYRYKYPGNGAGTNIYVIDSGVRMDHLEFVGRTGSVFDFFGKGGVDCAGHGTHVAGTAAGITFGVAKGAKVHNVRVLDCQNGGSTQGIIAGIDHVTRTSIHPAVAQMSLGGEFSVAMNDAVKGLFYSGVLPVVAAGNDNEDACYVSPANLPEALTVGATEIIFTPAGITDRRAQFSNWGRCVNIFAPGFNIFSAMPYTPWGNGVQSGTSMACPHVSGAAAVILGKSPQAHPGWLGHQIVSTATPNIVADSKFSANLLLYIGL